MADVLDDGGDTPTARAAQSNIVLLSTRLDRGAIERRLARVEERLAYDAEHIARQRELIAVLEQEGRDATAAHESLARFETALVLAAADHDRLRRLLAERAT
jgi:hypothetical protein